MRRRDFVRAVGSLAGLGAIAHPTRAQEQVRRVGALLVGEITRKLLEDGLKQRGWRVGQNLIIEYRIYNGDTDLGHRYARELVSLKPDVLFALTNTSMAALQAEGSTIPTVFAMVSDPVGMHYVDSFSKPGHNVTGFTPFEPSLGGKWVSLLKEIAPNIQHIGLVYNPEPGNNAAAFRKTIDKNASTSGIMSVEAPSGGESAIERLIVSFKEKSDSGLIFLPDAFTSARPDHFTALVGQCRIPAIYPLRYFCEAGGLISYGVYFTKVFAGAVSYVDRILRGANPAELPVQAPTEFELVVNKKTARQLGLHLPSTLLARADDVIE
jgi:putative tryptophan/tyrosine transport system substrate-binding protein